MAGRVSAGGLRDVHPSQEDSDDEIFETDSHQPTKRNGFPQTFGQSNQARVRESSSSSGQLQQPYFASRPRSLSSENDEQLWGSSPPPFRSTDVFNRNRSASEEQVSYTTGHQHRRPFLQERQHSIVDGLLFEIYDRWHGSRADSFDSDTFTECSSTSEVFHSRWDTYEAAENQRHSGQLHRSFLETQSLTQLRKMVADLQRSVGQVSTRLVRQLKRRDRRHAKLCRNCDIVTAILQAASLKRQIDTRMKFSIEPPPGQSAFDQWKDAMKAVNRLPMGIPPDFRRKVWLSLADHYIRQLKIDWQKTVRFAFNERSNPDDDKLGMQIVKDLHRTGCSSFSGQDNEEDRAVLKRVLLAYARWNKRVGYCQGFNVIAALLLNVMERKEDDALKVMIYLIDHVLPESYFDNNLRALSVDMAVFRDLLRLTLPTLSRHLDRLQHAAQDITTGACYEPPLTNVFTMQWFLTIFANGLPKEVVLRVWDALLLEGSEVLLRTALCIWGKLARRIMRVGSADEFYSLMGELSSDMMQGTVFNGDDIVKAIYSLAPFPFPQITELRERYTYNIRPFSSTPAQSKRASRMAKAVLYSDEDDLDDEELRDIASFSGMDPVPGDKGKGMEGALSSADISLVGPGAYGAEADIPMGSRDAVYMERMSTDISALKMQYEKLRLRQRQAHIIIAAASAKKKVEVKQKVTALVPKIETPTAMNHLFVGKAMSGGRNRLVTDAPRIAVASAPRNSLLTKQLQAVAAAQAASRSKRNGKSPIPSRHVPSSPSRLPSDMSGFVDSGNSPEHTTDKNRNKESSRDVDKLETPSPLSLPGQDDDGQASDRVTVASEHCSASSDGSSSASGTVKDSRAEATLQRPVVPPRQRGSRNSEDRDQAVSVYTGSEGSVFGDDDPYTFVPEDVESGVSDTQKGEAGDEDLGGIVIAKDPTPSRKKSLDVYDPNGNGSCNSGASSPEKKAQRPVSIQLPSAEDEEEYNQSSNCTTPHDGQNLSKHSVWHESASSGDLTQLSANQHATMTRSLSAPYGCGGSPRLHTPTHTTPVTPVHDHISTTTTSSSTITPKQLLSSPSKLTPLSSPVKTNKPFNPFPVKHVNTNRAKTGLKLGLYTPSTLEHIQGQLLGGLSGKKSRNASS